MTHPASRRRILRASLAAAIVGALCLPAAPAAAVGAPAPARAEASLASQVDLGTVAITGTPTTGVTLKATHDRSSGTAYFYSWYADGTAIAGARSSTLVLSAAQQHKQITVTVTGIDPDGLLTTATSDPTPQVMLTTTIGISGKRAIMQDVYSNVTRSTLSVTRGTWTSGTTVTHQWYADGQAIPGATGSSYRLRMGDVGRRITVKTTAEKAGYATVTRTSPTTLRIAQVGLPMFHGHEEVHSPISNYGWGDWTPGTKRVFRVYVEGRLIDSDTAMMGTFPTLWADIPKWAAGKRLTLKVTGSKPGFTTYTVTAVSDPIRDRDW